VPDDDAWWIVQVREKLRTLRAVALDPFREPAHRQALGDAAAGGGTRLAQRLFRHAARPIDNIWTISVGSDFKHAGTTGDKPLGTDVLNRSTARLTRRMNTDPVVATAFAPADSLLAPATTLLRPRVARRVLFS
jgi:hypothetical protein